LDSDAALLLPHFWEKCQVWGGVKRQLLPLLKEALDQVGVLPEGEPHSNSRLGKKANKIAKESREFLRFANL
jgi:hypothetical protein